MPLHVQVHTTHEDGSTGLGPAFLTEALTDRRALYDWCKSRGLGWFRLEQISDYFHGSALWQAVWPMTKHRYQFVVSRA